MIPTALLLRRPFEPTSDGEEEVFHTFGFLQNKRCIIYPDMILLDSEFTICTMHNERYVKNMCVLESGKTAKLHTNGGSEKSSLTGNFIMIDITVW